MKLLDREACRDRLRLIFPPALVEDHSAVAGPIAGAAVYVCLFVGALEEHNPMRPSMVLWMCDGVAGRARRARPERFAREREQWYRAARRGHKALARLLSEWQIEHRPWYADTSREPLRDETFREWLRLSAMTHDPSLSTTSPSPAWTLRGDFAALFKPELRGAELRDEIERWQREHLGTVGRARTRLATDSRAAQYAVEVRLPDGSVRPLAPGLSSLILKGVIEQLAPRLLGAPGVVAISQSKRKIDVTDDALLKDLGLTLAAGKLLPDALLFDAAEPRFWFVEAVATDGEIHEERKRQLLAWAAAQGIEPERCGFVTAFLSRTHDAFRRRVGRLAWGTSAWCLDEPERIIRLDDLAG